jgi:uncharacterized radical SAM protein YgiQ
MGEAAIIQIAKSLAAKTCINDITDIRGTGYITEDENTCAFPSVTCASFASVAKDKKAYAQAVKIQHDEFDPIRGRAIIQRCKNKALIVNPPPLTPNTEELDRIYALPYTREVHPMYEKDGGVPSADVAGVPAIEEVRFSVIHNRGCFGACNFCALAFHQGRTVASRSHESIVREVESFITHPEFKGYVHDVGGPTANFRKPSCKKQLEKGICAEKTCLTPPCGNLDTDHSDYLLLLRKLTAIKGVKKVFVRSGIRFDYMMLDKSGEFFTELVKNHISGQLKVAPEHCMDNVLYHMGKPENAVFEKFFEKFKRLNTRYQKEQYLVPYLISSHPGSTVDDAIKLALYLKEQGRQPEQVQDFYPTPGTISTCMYYTGIDPRTMKPVYVPRSKKEKTIQRALLQWKNPKNREIVRRALREAGREDLIGYGKFCLIRPK